MLRIIRTQPKPMRIPEEIPAMSLSGAVLLPKTIMPLRIFEERYRQMLTDALGGNRMFAIANRIAGKDDQEKLPLELHNIATIGLIRMSTENPDGTSILMLEGTDRVRIDAICQTEPYPTLKISALPTINRPEEAREKELTEDLLEKVEQLTDLLNDSDQIALQACRAIDDLEMLCHFIMQTFCTSSSLLQNTLEETDLVARCGIVSDYLELQIMLLSEQD